jgi:hypothetical protein
MENYFLFFTSQTFQEPLVIPISFPDVIGALAPTVTVALVNTVSTLRIAERFTLTHKEYANKPTYTQPAFQFFLSNKE